MKPQLRFKEFTDEWEEKTLAEITIVITKGTTPKMFTSRMNDINFIKIDCLFNGFIDKTKCLKISNEIHNNELKRSILIENDLLFSIAGSLGKVSIVNQNILPANTNQALSIIRLKDNVCVNYVYFYLDSQLVKKYIFSLQSIGAQPNINLEQVSQIKIQLPSLLEQEKIGKFFSLLDQRIEKQERKVTLLEEEKKGYMQKLFKQELRFKEELSRLGKEEIEGD